MPLTQYSAIPLESQYYQMGRIEVETKCRAQSHQLSTFIESQPGIVRLR